MMDASNTLLKRLCSHVTGINDDRLVTHFQLAVSLLNEGPSHLSVKDHNVAEKIKRRLVREKRLEDAARFSGLMNRLLKSAVLQNKTSILKFFLALSQDNASYSSMRIGSPSSTARASHENGLCNGHRDDMLHLPKLHQHLDSSVPSENILAGTSPKYIVPESIESRSSLATGSNRVSRLAEMYKVAARKIPDSPFAELQHSSPTVDRLKLHHQHHKNTSFKEALIEVTEKVLIREVLFIFQGIEGKIIKMDANKDGYRLDPKVRLSHSQKEIILKLSDVGWLYNKVQNFCEWGGSIAGNERTSDRTASGLVNQSLVLALREELTEYCRLIALLEAQIQEGGDTPMGEPSGGLTLRRLVMWTLEPRARLRALAHLTHAAREVYGGACVSAIYQHMHHGNPGHRAVVRHVLSLACTPMYVMLTQWLLDGTLEDPHHEFFIASDPTVPDDKLWQDKYSIRWSMLPSFINKSQAQRVLASGKSLNFLRNVCHFRAPIAGRDAIKTALQQTTVESLFTQDESSQLDELIGLTFRETSCHVLEEILTRHKLMDHLRALRRYLLLGQGDFIHYLMEILNPELGRPATNLYPHNLSSLLETAVAASNAQYEEPDILKRLDVRLLEISPGDLGWDVFSLDYHVDGPIGTVFTGDCMRQYLMLFNALWKDKRMEMILSDIWKEQAATSKLCRDLPELGVVLHGLQLLTTEMVHLVHQMEYYMTFEVLECSWHGLMTKLKSAQSLDDVIAAHNHFLNRIVAGALLDAESKQVRTHLRTFYNIIQNLRGLQERLSVAVSTEVNARKNALAEVKARTDAGDFGTSVEHQEIEKKRRKEFISKVVPKLKSDLRINTQTYRDMVQSFLLMLTQHEDQNLHLLSTRLDFNEYYHNRDDRLNQRLTYHHKRKSMGTSFCQ
nr:gamma-tubulin complex component 3 homolog [Procambarus clarkii]